MSARKANIIVILCAAFLMAGCSTAFIQAPLEVKGPQCKVEVKSLSSFPGEGDFYEGMSMNEIHGLKRLVGDKYSYLKGENIVNSSTMGGTLGYRVTPGHKDLSFIRMKIKVTNTGNTMTNFDFDRVRIIFPKYVSKPFVVQATDLLALQGSTATLKPGEDTARILHFVYLRDRKPVRIVYDQVIQNRVSNKMVIAIPETGDGVQ